MRNKLRTCINKLILNGEHSYNTLKLSKIYLLIDAKNKRILEFIKLENRKKIRI